jgi:lipopolysaccharide/colanic/teichoic acid biosynthesis glycosyltransferase
MIRRLARPLLYLGIVGAVLALSKVHAVAHDYSYSDSSRLVWSIAYMALLAVTAYAVGLPEVGRTRSAFVAALVAAAGGVLEISVVQAFVGDALLPRAVVFGTGIVLVPWYVFVDVIGRDVRSAAAGRDRVLFVGAVDEGEHLREELETSAERPAILVHALSVEEASPIGSGDESVVDLAIDLHATVLVLSRAAQEDEGIVSQAATLHEGGVRVRTMTGFYEEWLGKLPISELERASLMFDIRSVHQIGYVRTKRMLDLVVGAIGAIPFLVALPFVLLGNLVGNRGPLFFAQPRVGLDGRPFSILKFRSMRPAPKDSGTNAAWTGESDPRITPFGRVLRVTHLDELPQVLNILRGDLSIVGPRPEQPQYVKKLREKIPFYDLRHLVRPGLTGWAQVKYHYGADENDALEKLQYEFFYLRHQGLGLDLRIIGRTTRSVFGGEGR